VQDFLGPENAPERPSRGPQGHSEECFGPLALHRARQQASDEVPLQGKEHDQRNNH